MKLRHLQCGYMMEVPMLMMAVGVVLAVLLPRLPLVWGKALMIMAALAWIAGLYYMIIVPGWTPGHQPRRHPIWRWSVFLALAALLIFVAGAYVAGAGPQV
ncbi:MAG TPA: hypothetical protein VFX02_02825 [Gammaproteobacteria bacterium]|nr:hypothetical protein [Gammaproteobacteria bacterium]